MGFRHGDRARRYASNSSSTFSGGRASTARSPRTTIGRCSSSGRSAIAGLATDLGATGDNLKLLAENAETMDANVDARMKGFQ